jgi:hypothetical protein
MYDDTTLDVALNQFQANKSHISLVQHPTPNISTAFLYRFDPHVRCNTWLTPTLIATLFPSPLAL